MLIEEGIARFYNVGEDVILVVKAASLRLFSVF